MNNGAKWLRFVIVFLFLVFITLYISQNTGYYEYEQHKKVSLTNEKIKQFENDVKDGKKVDVNNYLKVEQKNYNNNVSKSGHRLSVFLEQSFNGIMNFFFKIIEGLFA